MANKKILMNEVNAALDKDVMNKYGRNFAKAAREMGMSPPHLHKLLNKERNERSPDRLMKSLGYKYVTYVVRADK